VPLLDFKYKSAANAIVGADIRPADIRLQKNFIRGNANRGKRKKPKTNALFKSCLI